VDERRKESLAGLTKHYDDALKHVLPRMGHDPRDYPAYFLAVENLFSLYEVPKKVQSKWLIPLLNERSKTLLAKLARDKLHDYAVVKDYLLRVFKLMPHQYRDKYLSAQKLVDETYTLYGSRLRNYLQYYWDTRKVVSKDDVMELLLADRIKEALPEPCLRQIMASEGQDWFKLEKLTQVIDTYVASHGDTGRGVSVGSKPVKYFWGGSSPQVKSVSPSTTSTAQA